MWFEFFLMTGMREQEVMNTYWSDINFNHAVVRMTHKPDRGWTPKAYKEREIPIPDKLVQRLKAWKAKSDKTCGLVFSTAGCRPKMNFLDDLKAAVERAKLSPEKYWLHKYPCDVCNVVAVGRCRFADGAAVVRALGHGKHSTIFETR